MKMIIVQWHRIQYEQYDMEMRVVESNHPRFTKGTRFDFGFFNVATREGYAILSLPAA